ncbi:MAG: hypothetical protein ACE5D7_07980 [Fidelibacterota bacterium]
MKKIKFSFILIPILFCIALTWYACQKEKVTLPTEQSSALLKLKTPSPFSIHEADTESSLIPACPYYYSQIGVTTTGMLSFVDSNHFEQVIKCLEKAVDDYNDAFEAVYGELSDDEIEKVIDSLNFNEDQPLIDLENSLNFYSLRKDIEAKMDVWLDNYVLDMGTNPDNHIILDEETRTLLTPDCMVMIGGQVYNFCQPDISVSPPKGDEDKSLSFCLPGNCCFWGGSDDDVYYENENKRIIVYVSLRNKIGISKAKAKVISCKKKSNGKWKRFRTRLSIRVGGVTHPGSFNCTNSSSPFNKKKPPEPTGTKRRKKLRVAVNSWGLVWQFAMNNEIGGTGTAGSNMAVNLTVPLTF